jgi:hypothetical protein
LAWVGLREALALQQFEKHFSVTPRHVGGRLAVTRRIAENTASRRSPVPVIRG